MKSSVFILLSILLIANPALSQQDSIKRFHAIKTYPFNLIKVVEFNLAYETNIDDKNGMEFLIGTSLNDHVFYTSTNLLYWLSSESNIDDFQPSSNMFTRICYKRYFGKENSAANKFYVSPQLMFKYSFLNNIKYTDTYDGTYEAMLDMTRFMTGLHIIFGKQSVIPDSRVLIGWYLGAGFKYSYYEKVILESWQYYPLSEDDHYSNEERTYHYPVFIFPSFYCGLSIGMFWDKNK